MQAIRRAAPDRIFLRDHVVEMEVGAFAEEYGRTQRVRFSVTLDVDRGLDLEALGGADDVATVVSYDDILTAIAALASGPRIALLETFAERLAAACLSDPRVLRAEIRMEKMDRVSGALGVEITRSRA